MTIPDDEDAERRIARKNAMREAEKASKCPHCGKTDQWRLVAAIWKAAYALRDDQLADIAWDYEQRETANGLSNER